VASRSIEAPRATLTSARKRARRSEVSAIRRALPLGHEGGEGQSENGAQPYERLEEEQRLVGIWPGEGTLAVKPSPDAHTGEDEGRSGRLALTEAEGRPYQRGYREEVYRVGGVGLGQDRPEHELSGNEHSEKQQAGLEEPGRVPAPGLLLLRPEDQDGRDDDHTHRVAQPPGEPDRAGLGPGSEAGEDERAYPDGGAHQSAHEGGEHEKGDHVLRPRKSAAPRSEARHEIRPQHGFQGVACGDPQRCRDRPRSGHVGEERPHEDRRPHPGTTNEEGGECDASGRPDGGRARMNEGQAEAELGRQ